MRIGIISGVIGLFCNLTRPRTEVRFNQEYALPDVVVTESYQQRQAKKSALTVEVIEQDFFLRKHFTETSCRQWRTFPEYKLWT